MTVTNDLASGIVCTDQWWNEYQEERERAETHRIELFFRSLAPTPGTHGQRTQILEQVETASEHDIIDDYDITVLGDEICLCQRCQQAPLSQQYLELIETLIAWRDGATTSTGFTEREVNSSVTGDHYRTIVPPESLVATYMDGEIYAVFPCVRENIDYSVLEFFDDLLAELPDQPTDTGQQLTH
jgi:hypothetical protein